MHDRAGRASMTDIGPARVNYRSVFVSDDENKTANDAVQVSIGGLSRLPAKHLSRLLLECAAEDSALLARLHAAVKRAVMPDANRLAEPAGQACILGNSPAIRRVNEVIARFAQADEPVLITGESGTGKELAARAIHQSSRRWTEPFIAVNCAAIPPNLVASELFGYERGAFTGAATQTKGQIEHAQGGTLFLDEIGDMPIDLQGHLLRFLQEAQIVRVGGRKTIMVDVRVVSATNVRLRQAIAAGRFREDLYYRLNVLTLHLPALRARPEDIETLARYFLAQAGKQFGRDVHGFEPAAVEALWRHSWPGNVRELMSTIRRAVVMGDERVIRAADLIGLEESPPALPPSSFASIRPLPGSEDERDALVRALAFTGENVTLAAQELGVSRVTLYRMLRRHAIDLQRGLKQAPAVNSWGGHDGLAGR